MSYDVSIGDAWFNYTYNVSALFYEHFPNGRGINGLDGMTGKQAAEEIGKAFAAMNSTRHALGDGPMAKKYDAPNGWGHLTGALMFLGQILAACAANPRKKVTIS